MGSKYLYHGSAFSTGNEPLVPGFYHTGEEVKWDKGYETNKYLYATSTAREAILLGIGSFSEKEIGTVGFRYEEGGKDLHFIFDKKDLITEKELLKRLKEKVVYLYTINMKPEHGWLENKNPHNNIEGEYKTPKAIPRKDYVRNEIEVTAWLKLKGYNLITTTL